MITRGKFLACALCCSMLINGLIYCTESVNEDTDIAVTFVDKSEQIFDINYEQMASNEYRNRITSVFVKNSANLIEYRGFYGCQNLAFVNFATDSKVKEIGFMAFANCQKLKSIKIPDSVEYIGMGAFQGCSRLESVVLPNSLKTIRDDIFANCQNLKTLVIPDFVKVSISQNFDHMDVFLLVNGRISHIGNFPNGQLSVYKKFNLLRNLLIQGMEKCTFSESKINLPDGVEKLYLRDFWLNFSQTLKEITLPKTIDFIEKRAFEDYKSLETVIFTDGNKLINIQERCFTNCQNLNYVRLPNNLTKINGHMFFGCRQLRSINIPKNLRYVEPEAFYGCDNLATVQTPESIELYAINNDPETISIFCFNKNNGVFFKFKDFANRQIDTKGVKILPSNNEEFVLPEGVKEIANYTFEGQNFSSIKLPNTLRKIGKLAFSGCKKLTKIYIPDSVQTIENEAFFDCSNLTYIRIPVNCGKFSLSRGNRIGTTKISLLKAYGDVSEIGNFIDDKVLIEQSGLFVSVGKKSWHF